MAFSFMDGDGETNLPHPSKLYLEIKVIFKCIFWHWLGYHAGC